MSPVPRWIKFEEKVEKGGERWSKPHVATLSLHSLMELKMCIEKGTIMLDLEATTLPQVVGKGTLLFIQCFCSFLLAFFLSAAQHLSRPILTLCPPDRADH